MRVIQVVADSSHLDTLSGIAEQHAVADYWYGEAFEDGRRAFHLLVDDTARQSVIDALQSQLGGSEGARIIIMPVDAVLPRKEEVAETGKAKAGSGIQTREELYDDIERCARLDSTFLLLVFLSTIVASIGLIENNIAVIVGAMVIAPLLGPNIALAFATSLGDRELMWQALKTNLAGLSLTLVMAMAIGMIWPTYLNSFEILVRTDVKPDGIVLALASGAAAVLSLATGLSSALVGVMVAVALLPPAATTGMMLGSGQPALANGRCSAAGRECCVYQSGREADVPAQGGQTENLAGEAQGKAVLYPLYPDLDCNAGGADDSDTGTPAAGCYLRLAVPCSGRAASSWPVEQQQEDARAAGNPGEQGGAQQHGGCIAVQPVDNGGSNDQSGADYGADGTVVGQLYFPAQFLDFRGCPLHAQLAGGGLFQVMTGKCGQFRQVIVPFRQMLPDVAQQ